MTKKLFFDNLLMGFFIAFNLAACGSGSHSAGAPAAVETYVNALAARNSDALVNAACASWEASAREEFDSFAAVSVTVENMQCQSTGTDGDATLVACTGKIVANYGNEVLEINLAERSYRVIQEGGEWRVCGYR